MDIKGSARIVDRRLTQRSKSTLHSSCLYEPVPETLNLATQ